SDRLRRSLSGDPESETRLVAVLTPVVHIRVARKLRALQYLSAGGRDVRQEVEDLCQDVFLALFQRDAHVLRAWRPERGLSLESFVGLVAERKVFTFFRNGRSNPWREELTLAEGELEWEAPDSWPDEIAASRELLSLLLDRL